MCKRREYRDVVLVHIAAKRCFVRRYLVVYTALTLGCISIVIHTSVELMQIIHAVSNVTAMESSRTSGNIPTKVHEHSPSQPSGIPEEFISSTRVQCFIIRKVPVSLFIATATISTGSITAIRSGWCSTAGDIISHTVQCILIFANDRLISHEYTMVREHCTLQSKARTCYIEER